MKNLQNQFPVLQEYTYLNTAASGLLPREVWEFRKEHDWIFLHKASIFRAKSEWLFLETKEALNRLFHCDPENIVLLPNFSLGFKLVLEQLPISNKILLIENDYPSINHSVENAGFKTCYAGLNENLEQNIFKAVKKHEPEVLALSLVQYINGIKIDLVFLRKLKYEFPELLIIADGTQFCGMENFNFKTSGIDILGVSTYKWMNAGYGNAFLFFEDSVLQKLKHSKEFSIESMQPGHLDTLNMGSLLHAVRFIEEVGMDAIETKLKSLSSEVKKALEARNLLELSVVRRSQHAPIFNIKGDKALFDFLTARKIITSQRGAGIRLSFHYFNGREELSTLLQALDAWENQ